MRRNRKTVDKSAKQLAVHFAAKLHVLFKEPGNRDDLANVFGCVAEPDAACAIGDEPIVTRHEPAPGPS